MTQEQKAKAYDEALEKARMFWETDNDNTLDIKARGTMEHLFPELRESNDEKTRKEILEFFQQFENNELRGVNISDWIVWLEKQEGCEHIRKEWFEHIKQSWYKEGFIDGKYSNKTPKEWTINDATTLNELIDFLENGTAKLQHDLTRYANWLKIQFTPIEKQCNPTDEEMKELLRTEYEKGRADAFAEMEKEQSENDEKWSEKDD